jgi:hypothetical protein
MQPGRWFRAAALLAVLGAGACGGNGGKNGTAGTGGSLGTAGAGGGTGTGGIGGGGGGTGTVGTGGGGVVGCLDVPGALDRPPNGTLPCELIPPGLRL